MCPRVPERTRRESTIDAAAFRAVLGQWPTGVTLVTTVVDGTRYGVTASSFSSVSLDPPLVSVCLARTAFAHDLVHTSRTFGVTILAKDHAELGQRFARFDPAAPDRFVGAHWETAVTGSPLLTGALGWLDCRVHHAYDGGDHTIFVGEVLAAATPRTTSPLLYHSRTWGQFADQLPDEVLLSTAGADDIRVDALAGPGEAIEVLSARRDVHQRPRLLLDNAFTVGAENLGELVGSLARLAPSEVVLVDRGTATPVQVREGCREAVLHAKPVPVSVQLTNAAGVGQANLLTALKSGVARLALAPGSLSLSEITLLIESLGLRLQGALS